jgi:polar amino acid transport system substrate-binding protein
MFERFVMPLIVVCMLLLGIAIPSIADDKPLYVDGIDAGFPPFSYIDENGNPDGFDVEVLKWIANEMGFEVKIVPVDWDAIIPTLKLGTIDMIASGMTITNDRLQQVDFTDPYWTIDLAVVVRKVTNDQGESVPELNIFSAVAAGQTVGVQRGTTSQTWIQENLIDEGVAVNQKLYDSFLFAVEDLLIGRVNAAIMDEPTARSAIAGRELALVGTINTGEIYGYAVRKGDVTLLSLLNEGLKRIKATDEWERLVEKWLIGS